MSNCLVVIPAYNEAATIRDVVTRTLAHVRDVIVVDDGSTDGTAGQLAGLPVTLLVNRRNRGKAAAVWRGARTALAAGAAGIATIDGDGQHDPDDLPRLFGAARLKPAALVIGARLQAKASMPKSRYRANRVATFCIAWAAGQPISDSQSGLRYYPAAVFRDLDVPHDRWSSFVFESEVLIAAARAGIEIASVPVSVRYAELARASHFRPVTDVLKITSMVAGRLLRSGLNLPGLLRSLRRPDLLMLPPESVARVPREP